MFPPTFYCLAVNLLIYFWIHLQGTTFVSFSSFTSTLKPQTDSQLTQSPFTGPVCLLFSLNDVYTRDGSVGSVVSIPRAFYWDTATRFLQLPLCLSTHLIDRGLKILEMYPKIWRNYKLLSPIFIHLQTLYSTGDYVEQNCPVLVLRLYHLSLTCHHI